MIVLLLIAAAQAAEPSGCRAFVEHLVRSRGPKDLDAARISCKVSDSGDSPGRPYVTVGCSNPKWSLDAFPGRGSDGYQVTLRVPPVRDFTYRLRKSERGCQVETVQVNGYPQLYKQDSCAKPQPSKEDQRAYVDEACALAKSHFAQPIRPEAPGGENATSPSRSRNAGGT